MQQDAQERGRNQRLPLYPDTKKADCSLRTLKVCTIWERLRTAKAIVRPITEEPDPDQRTAFGCKRHQGKRSDQASFQKDAVNGPSAENTGFLLQGFSFHDGRIDRFYAQSQGRERIRNRFTQRSCIASRGVEDGAGTL